MFKQLLRKAAVPGNGQSRAAVTAMRYERPIVLRQAKSAALPAANTGGVR